jgi:two-component system sensor histidine kinase KdpD
MRLSFLKTGKVSGALISIGAVILISGFLLPFRTYVNSTEVALTLLLLVLLSSTLFGSRAGLAASIAGILSFNFFFLPPFYTFNISGPENWVAFGAFIITALIAGQLSGYARRRAEESEARQEKIERLYDELKDAVEQVSEAEALRRSAKLKSALLDAVTHDLRTPLTSIKASVTTLLGDSDNTDLDDGSRREFLEIINEETDRLNDFIEGMVGIAKVEAGDVDVRNTTASVEEIIGNAVDRARIRIQDHVLETTVAPDIPPVVLDAASVSQVVFTLLDNAAKYSPRGSRIRLSAHLTPASMLRIVVEDQGKGIPSVDRERVFDKFFRLEESDVHTTAGGLGLGLTIARGMIESQGGRIWIEDGSRDFVTRVVCELPTESAALERKAASK